MACMEGDFSKDYLLLNPEKASLFDFVRILCFPSHKLKKRDFIDVQDPDHLAGIGRRWLIFVSLFVQKLLIVLKDPMALAGAMIENCLNLLSCNGGGILSLLLNYLTGKAIIAPEPSSQEFSSVIGCIDTRVKLDRNIENTDIKYKSQLSIMAAKLAYENEGRIKNVVENVWEMEFLGFFDCWDAYLEKWSTQAMMFKDKSSFPNKIVVAFRGTSPFNADDWRTDVDFSWYNLHGVGKVHGGFMKALGLQKNSGWPKEIPEGPSEKRYAYYDIRQKLRQLLREDENATFIITGHSLGGALAILFAGVLMFHEEEELLKRLDGVHTFGQPRVGDNKFGDYMMTRMLKYNVKYFRYVYCNDVVCRLPYDDKTLMYKHFGRCLYFNSLYEGEVCEEEPNKNYFSPLWALPMVLNAIWELGRGFILPLVKDKEYQENGVCRLVRMSAIMFPGLSNHSPQDYTNLTRLGTLQIQSTNED